MSWRCNTPFICCSSAYCVLQHYRWRTQELFGEYGGGGKVPRGCAIYKCGATRSRIRREIRDKWHAATFVVALRNMDFYIIYPPRGLSPHTWISDLLTKVDKACETRKNVKRFVSEDAETHYRSLNGPEASCVVTVCRFWRCGSLFLTWCNFLADFLDIATSPSSGIPITGCLIFANTSPICTPNMGGSTLKHFAKLEDVANGYIPEPMVGSEEQK